MMETRHLRKRIVYQRREIKRLLILEKLYWKFVKEWRDEARGFERKIATLEAAILHSMPIDDERTTPQG